MYTKTHTTIHKCSSVIHTHTLVQTQLEINTMASECMRWGYSSVWLCEVCICVSNTLPSIWAPARSSSEGERRGSGAHSAERPLATMPAQSLQHIGTPVARYVSLSLSASRLSPNPHLFLSASIFLSSQRVCPYSLDISSPCRRGAAANCGVPW